MAVHSMYVGPVVAQKLESALPKAMGDHMRILPTGQSVLVGTEKVYYTGDMPRRCVVDIGGDSPFILFPQYPSKEHGGEG